MKADIERTEDGGWGCSSWYGFNSLIGIENKRKTDSITIHFWKNGKNSFWFGSTSFVMSEISEWCYFTNFEENLVLFPFRCSFSIFKLSNLLFIQMEMMLCIKILYLLSLHCQLHAFAHLTLHAILHTLYFTYHTLYSVSQISFFLYHISYL